MQMTKQVSKIKKLTVSEIIDKNNRLIEALKNLNDKLCVEDKIELKTQNQKAGRSSSSGKAKPI